MKRHIRRIMYFTCDMDYLGFNLNVQKYSWKGNYIFQKIRWIFCLLWFGASAEDYFMYEFYKKNFGEINKFVTLRRRRFVTEILNRKGHREWVEDKSIFAQKYKDFLLREVLDLRYSNYQEYELFIDKHDKVIAKPIDGYEGKGILIIRKEDNIQQIYHKLKNDYILEKYLEQTGIMRDINSGTCNTIRINVLNNHRETPKIITACLRMGQGNGGVDNFHCGGIVAAIDIEEGIISSLGKNINGKQYCIHPSSGIHFVGLEIPYWEKIVDTVCKASERLEGVGYSSWDVALIGDSVAIIEGNTYGNMDVQQCMDQIGKWKIYKDFTKKYLMQKVRV